MPIRFEPVKDDEFLVKEYPELIDKIDKAIQSGDYEVRSVYTALAALTESYREAMRAMVTDKEYFDNFMDTVNIEVTTLASSITRPIFKKHLEDEIRNE